MNLYKVLNVDENATMKEIKKAYHILAKQYHPDKNRHDTAEKYDMITYAYHILKNEKTRQEYDMMNNLNKSKFQKLLESLFNTKLDLNKMKDIGIYIDQKDFDNIETSIEDYLNLFNINDLFNLITNNIIAKKDIYDINCSDSDIDLWSETYGEYYNELPIIYQKYNKNNIFLTLDTTIENFINNNIRKIKIKRNIDNTYITNTFKFYMKSNYIVFKEGGDYNGHLIINLKLPKEYIVENNTIFYILDITTYEYFYGVNKNIIILNKKYSIITIPYIDGIFYYLENNIKNYNIIIKFNHIYCYTENNKKIMNEYFN